MAAVMRLIVAFALCVAATSATDAIPNQVAPVVMSACWSRTVLRTMGPAWPGQCLGLTAWTNPQVGVPPALPLKATKEQCQAQCQNDVTCSVWQHVTDTGCFTGLGTDCMDRAGGDLLTLSGAERIQQGTVNVLKNMNDTWIYGLTKIGSYSAGTSKENSDRCANSCYSNVRCQFWQFGTDGCYVETEANQTTFPLPACAAIGDSACALSASVTGDASPARGVIAAEYIQHVCPPVTTPAPVVVEADNTLMYVGLALLALVIAAVIAFCFCSPDKKATKRAVKKTRAVKVAAKVETPVEPESVPLVPLMMPAASSMQYIPTQTYQQPMMQFAAAPQVQYAAAPGYLPVQQQQFAGYSQFGGP